MPDASSNIPSIIFYGSIFSEFLRIARCGLLFEDFIQRARELFTRMIVQGGLANIIIKQIRKAITRYPDVFSKFAMNHNEISKALQHS